MFVPPILLAQDSAAAKQDTVIKLNGKYLLSYWHDTKAIVKQPFKWKAKQWGTLAGVTGIWLVTYAYDKEIYDYIQKNRSGAGNSASTYLLEPWGSGIYSVPLLAGIYIFSNKNTRHRRVALTGLKAYILSGGAAALTKNIFHRHRPYEDDPPYPYHWDGPLPFRLDHASFPSGHTTAAFAVASVLAFGYNDKPWIGITSYTVASLVGLSRINDDKHWASDVVAGAALGSFIGITLSKVNFKHLSISPEYSQRGPGLHISYKLN